VVGYIFVPDRIQYIRGSFIYLCVYSPEEELLRCPQARPAGIMLTNQQVERLRKAAEKAEQAQAKIEKRKQDWARL